MKETEDYNFCMTYENHPHKTMYFKANINDLYKYKDKKGFKAFTYKHKPTRIAMVKIIDNKIEVSKYNG